MPTPTSASRVRAAEKRTRETLVRCVGEHGIPYRVEVLGVMARYVVRDQLKGWPPMPEVEPEEAAPPPAPLPPEPEARPRLGLSLMDRQVLRLVAGGLENLEIATRLGVTEHAVKNRIKRLYVVLDARNRAHAVALGFEAGLLGDGSSS